MGRYRFIKRCRFLYNHSLLRKKEFRIKYKNLSSKQLKDIQNVNAIMSEKHTSRKKDEKALNRQWEDILDQSEPKSEQRERLSQVHSLNFLNNSKYSGKCLTQF